MFSVKMVVLRKALKIEFFDTAGQEDFSSIRQASLTGVDCCIICYSCESSDSLQNIKTLWVPEIKGVDSEPTFVLVGTKSDLYDSHDPFAPKLKTAKGLGKALGAYKVMKCSALLHAKNNGKKGNISKVFGEAIKAGLIRHELLQQRKRFICTIL